MKGKWDPCTNLYMLNLTPKNKLMIESTTPDEYFAGSTYECKSKLTLVESCSSPRWDNSPSGHQRYPLFGLNLGYMYLGQKTFLNKLIHINTCTTFCCMYCYVSIYSEECFWPQYMHPKLIPFNKYRWCPLGELSHLCLEQLRCPFAVIYNSGRYFEISFSVGPGHVEKYPSLIAWSRVSLVGQQRIWW